MLTGIQFEFQAVTSKSRRRPFAPSLDRIDHQGDYTADNCRVICSALNYALGDWGMESLMRIARRLVARERDVMAREKAHIEARQNKVAMRVNLHNETQKQEIF